MTNLSFCSCPIRDQSHWLGQTRMDGFDCASSCFGKSVIKILLHFNLLIYTEVKFNDKELPCDVLRRFAIDPAPRFPGVISESVTSSSLALSVEEEEEDSDDDDSLISS